MLDETEIEKSLASLASTLAGEPPAAAVPIVQSLDELEEKLAALADTIEKAADDE